MYQQNVVIDKVHGIGTNTPKSIPPHSNTGVVSTSPEHSILYGNEFHACLEMPIAPSMQCQGLDSRRLSAPEPSL